jgi:hypothetical protein
MKYWTSYDVTVRARRSKVSIASRLFGLLILFLAVVFWPTAVMAADSGVETQRNTAVVFTVLILFVGSVTGGVLFVSPLGRRFNRPPVPVAATEVTIQTVSTTSAHEPELMANLVLARFHRPTSRPSPTTTCRCPSWSRSAA